MINNKIIKGLDELVADFDLMGYSDAVTKLGSIKAIYLKDNAPRTKKTVPKRESIAVEITQGTSTHTLQFDSSKALETALKQIRKTHDAQVDDYCKKNDIWKPIYRYGEQARYDTEVEIFKNKMEVAKLNLSLKIHQDYDAI